MKHKMTKEEAIEILKNTAWLGTNEDRVKTEEAVAMAIQAIEVDLDSVITAHEDIGYEKGRRDGYAEAIEEAESVKAIGQFKWERDVAIKQLNEIGKGLGSKMDDVATVVRCKYCRWGREVCGNIECSADSDLFPEYHGYEWFCPNGKRRTEVEE